MHDCVCGEDFFGLTTRLELGLELGLELELGLDLLFGLGLGCMGENMVLRP